MAFEFDVIIQARTCLLPLGEDEALGRQRVQRGPVQLLEQFAARARQFTKRPLVETRQQFPNRFVQFAEREEAALAQRRQNPALHDEHARFDLGFVAGMPGPRRHHGHAVMRGPVLIGAVQLRLPVAGLVDAGFPLVGHDDLRGALEVLEHARVGADPVRQAACPGGLGIGVVTGAQHGDEDVGGARLAGGGVDDGDLVAGVIDEDFFAGAVVLAQDHVEVPRPGAVLLAEPAVAWAVGVLLDELLPEQLQGDVLVGLQFLVDFREVRLGFGRLRAAGRRREQTLRELRFVERLR